MSEQNKTKVEKSVYNGEYPEIYGNPIDVKSVESKMNNQKVIYHLILIAVFFSVFSVVVNSYNEDDLSLDYIRGNTLYVSSLYGVPLEKVGVGNPWVGASFPSHLLYEPLFITDSSYTEINSRLAQSYSISDDGLTYTIIMGDNNYWSDGMPITVDDVVFSLHGFMQCGYVNSYLSSAFNNIEGATLYALSNGTKSDDDEDADEIVYVDSISGISVNGNEITIKLIAPMSNFVLMLTQFVILPEHILKDEDMTTITTESDFFYNDYGLYSGQFMVQGLDEDLNIILVKNPYYTIETSEIDTVMLCWDTTNTELDYFTTSNLSQMVSHRSMKGYEEHHIEVFYYRYFIFNIAGGTDGGADGEENVAMHDPRVRQAILHAIDVETLINDVYLGKATQFYGGATSIAEEFYEYNPEKAKQLLVEAGYDFDRTFTIGYYSGDSYTRIFLSKIAEMLEDIGLTVAFNKTGAASLYSEGEFDMMMKNLSAFNVDEWYGEYLSTSANIASIMGDDGYFDSLIQQLGSTTTPEEYNIILKELVDLEQELLYKVPMFLLDEAVYINANRLYVPEDIVFGNTRYFSDIRLNEWYIKKA